MVHSIPRPPPCPSLCRSLSVNKNITMAESPSKTKMGAILPPTWPHRPETYILLFLLLLLITLLLHPSPPFPRRTLHIIAMFTSVLHLLEGMYALTLLQRIASSRNQPLPSKALLWVLQTTLVGFPSLFLLMHYLSKPGPPPPTHDD